MMPTVAACLLISFFFFMVMFYKLRFLCETPASQEDAKGLEAGLDNASTANAAGEPATHNTALAPIRHREYIEHGTTPHATDYRITITDEDANRDSFLGTEPRVNRATSYIRFTGFTRSDESERERFSSLSYWSELLLRYTVSESPPPSQPLKMDAATSESDVDTVEIADVNGHSRRNLLSFKPPRPRALTTKHIKKHATQATS